MSRARQAATLTAQGSSQPQGGQQPPPPPQNPLVDVDMESGASAGGAPHGPSSNIPGMGSLFQLMQLRQKDIICEHLDSAMLNKKGIILQYLKETGAGLFNSVLSSATMSTTFLLAISSLFVDQVKMVPSKPKLNCTKCFHFS